MASIDDKTQQLESTVSTVTDTATTDLIENIKSSQNANELALKKEQDLEELKVKSLTTST